MERMGKKTRYYVGPHITAAVQNKYLRYMFSNILQAEEKI